MNLAGEVIAKLWPMRTVIARNPLQGLEHLSFEEAVRRGEQLFGGQGSLPHDAFRRAVELARGQGVVVVTGSIHLAGIIRPLVRQCEQQPA